MPKSSTSKTKASEDQAMRFAKVLERIEGAEGEPADVGIECEDGLVVKASELLNLTSCAKLMGCTRQYAGALADGKHKAKHVPFKTVTIDGVRYACKDWVIEWMDRVAPMHGNQKIGQPDPIRQIAESQGLDEKIVRRLIEALKGSSDH